MKDNTFTLTGERLKAKYHDAHNEAMEKGLPNVGQYNLKMLIALYEMARANVYPDGKFGDEECSVWSLFHTAVECGYNPMYFDD